MSVRLLFGVAAAMLVAILVSGLSQSTPSTEALSRSAASVSFNITGPNLPFRTLHVEIDGTAYGGVGRDEHGGFGEGVYRSQDHGETWEGFGQGLVHRDITSLARVGDALVAGSWGQGLYVRRDTDVAWASFSPSFPPTNALVRGMAISGGPTPDLLVAVYPRKVYRLREGVWEDISKNLQPLILADGGPTSTDRSIRLVWVDTAGVVYAGLEDLGVYKYQESEQRWTRKGNLTTSVWAMDSGPDGTLWIGTGDGVYSWGGTEWVLDSHTTGWDVRALAVSPHQCLYAGLAEGEVHRRLLPHTQWHYEGSVGTRIWRLAFSRIGPERLFVGSDGGFFWNQPSCPPPTSTPTPTATPTRIPTAVCAPRDHSIYLPLILFRLPALKSADSPFAVPGEQRRYTVTWRAGRDYPSASVTDTLPGVVRLADLRASKGSPTYGDGAINWRGGLSAGESVTITYGVTVTHAPCIGSSPFTDIYIHTSNEVVLGDGKGGPHQRDRADLIIARPFGTGDDPTFDLAFGDADNDGDLDLAVGNHGDNQVCWNDGDGTYECQNAFGGGATFDLEWGDMDGDEFLDLVVANALGQENLLCLNKRNRTFSCSAFSTCDGPIAQCTVALGDVDNDEDVEIVLGNRFGPDLIYFNDGDGSFPITATTCYTNATLDLALGDLDNDGDLDLGVVGHSPDYVCVNDGTGRFTETRWLAYRTDVATWRIVMADADDDGDLDIAAAEAYDHPIEVYLNDGGGQFTQTVLIGPACYDTYGLDFGDADQDGDLDLALADRQRGVAVYINDPIAATDGITLTRQVLIGPFLPRPLSVAFGDVDGDKDLDLAVGRDGGQNMVYLNTLVECGQLLPMIVR